MDATIDRAGRLIVPKPVREAAQKWPPFFEQLGSEFKVLPVCC